MARLPVTMKDVAAAANVSMMTVSRVLRNDPRVAAATRRRVMEAVAATGYRANPMVGAWMAHMRAANPRRTSHDLLAFLASDSDRKRWDENLTVRSYHDGAAARAEQLGFRLERLWLEGDGMTGRRMSRILRSRGISAILLAPLPIPVATVEMEWEHFASVAFGYSMRRPNVHRVTNHQIHTMRLALSESARLGYRRVGLALERQKDTRVDFNWTTGLLHHQGSIAPGDRVPPFLPEKLRKEEFLEWVQIHRPEVILAGRRDMIGWLDSIGLRVPDDIGFITLEYYPEHGDVAGVDQNSPTIGAAAVDLVVEQLYHNERGIPEKPKVVMIEGCWRAGGSVRQVKDPAAAL